MLYYILRPYVTFILKFFVKRIEISGVENIPKKGAVLLASNHPNSFFDAILLCCTLDRRIWSLARGDAFKKPLAKKILMSLFMMPIYRLSEGKENMGENDETFKKCHELFEKNEMVLIFSEGLCTNQTELLPLKKGTGRLIQKEWLDGQEVTIVPVGLMYDSFDKYGKGMTLNIGKPIRNTDFEEVTNDGFFLKTFNDRLKNQLSSLISHGFKAPNFFNNPLYYIGWLINFPVYFLAQSISRSKTKGTVFFDSVTLAVLIFLLPIYWLILFFVVKGLI